MLIDDMFYQMKEFDTALDYLHAALDLQLRDQSPNQPVTRKIEELIAKTNHVKRFFQ